MTLILIWVVLYCLLLIILPIIADKKVKVSKLQKDFEVSLNKMNKNIKNKYILGYITIALSLIYIIDAFTVIYQTVLTQNATKRYNDVYSPLFGIALDDPIEIIIFIITTISLFGWTLWMISKRNYKEKNKATLLQIIKQKDERIAEEKKYEKKIKDDKEKSLARLTKKYGKPERITVDYYNQYIDFLIFHETQHIYINGHIIQFNNLISSEIEDNAWKTKVGTQKNETINTNGTVLGRAIIGGAVAGPLGAVVAGATSNKQTIVKDNTRVITTYHYYVVLNVIDKVQPVIRVDCGKNGKYTAEKINAIFQGIIAEKETGKDIKSFSVADELEKLVSLRDKGILSPEEFEKQKSKLLL